MMPRVQYFRAIAVTVYAGKIDGVVFRQGPALSVPPRVPLAPDRFRMISMGDAQSGEVARIVLMREKIAKALSQAVLSYRAGRWDEAERLCRQLLGLAPGHVQGLHLLGTLQLQTGRPAEAIVPLSRALTERPEDAALHNLLGTCYLQLERHEEAVASFDIALGLKPDFAEARCALGVALAGLGRDEDAIAAFVRALALNPDMVQAHYNLAGLFAARRQAVD